MGEGLSCCNDVRLKYTFSHMILQIPAVDEVQALRACHETTVITSRPPSSNYSCPDPSSPHRPWCQSETCSTLVLVAGTASSAGRQVKRECSLLNLPVQICAANARASVATLSNIHHRFTVIKADLETTPRQASPENAPSPIFNAIVRRKNSAHPPDPMPSSVRRAAHFSTSSPTHLPIHDTSAPKKNQPFHQIIFHHHHQQSLGPIRHNQ